MKGEGRYLYRAVDKMGQTIDFLLTEQRDEQAAKRFLIKAIRRHGVPEKITIDGSAANKAAIKSYNEEHGTAITIRKIKYLNNIVEVRFVGQKPGFPKSSGDWPQVRTGDPERTCELDSGVGVIPTALGEGLMYIAHGSDWSSIRAAGMKAEKREA